MNDTYFQHASVSAEYIEGKKSALIEKFAGAKMSNPYSHNEKESRKWLDWKLGYDSEIDQFAANWQRWLNWQIARSHSIKQT
jgi:hypothetical protein